MVLVGDAHSTLYPVPGNEVPPDTVCQIIPSKDGTRLRAAVSRTPSAKGTVVIAPGRGDFIERYFETIRDLAARGLATAIFDFRSQGGSARPYENPYRSNLDSFVRYDEDLAAFMTGVVLPDCPPPYYGLGHSTGGHVMLRALRTRTWFEKVVLTSPLLGIPTGAWPMPVVRILPSLVTALGLGWAFLPGQLRRPMTAKGFPGNDFTSDHVRFMRDMAILDREPSLGLGGPSFAWLRAAIASMDELHNPAKTKDLRSKVLIVAAGRDRVVRTEATRDFAREVPGVSFIVIAEALHEILVEATPIREQFFAAFDSFIAQSGAPQR